MTVVTSNPQARTLKRLWARLPAGALGEQELDNLIIEAANLYEGDYAAASALRSSLLMAQAVTVRHGDKVREFVYERAEEFPEHPVNGPGSEAFNAELQRQHREHEQLMRLEDEAQAQALADSPWGVQRRQMVELIDQRIDERIGALLRSLDGDSVARLRDRLTAADGRETKNEGQAKAGQED